MNGGNGKASREANEDASIVLGILQAIDSGERVTQRAVANELGIALGLVNAYLKRCTKKGLIKVRSAPARRYAYYLTPKGFSEKSKLTASYLAHSFSFFRTARADCRAILAEASLRRMRRLALIGAGDLAEIMILYAVDHAITLVAIVDSRVKDERFGGLKVVSNLSETGLIDGLIVTDLADPHTAYSLAVATVGAERVLVPALLKMRRPRRSAPPRSDTNREAR